MQSSRKFRCWARMLLAWNASAGCCDVNKHINESFAIRDATYDDCAGILEQGFARWAADKTMTGCAARRMPTDAYRKASRRECFARMDSLHGRLRGKCLNVSLVMELVRRATAIAGVANRVHLAILIQGCASFIA